MVHKLERTKRVCITEVPPVRKVEIVKVLRDHLGLGLAEAKELADNPPIFVRGQLSESEADRLIAALQDAGATVGYSKGAKHA